ncbi:PE domain-containing protein [Nocardia shimofusensis]|uniref:PE domain-containing protein n=1 Tax=Nocardia shimofusensis TaxID=228596 RepID=UPI0008344653|nr:PE domain-containing protein [Nocardia shimofusensis]
MVSGGVDFAGVQFDPVAAQEAANRLDGLADRLERGLRDNEPALAVEPAGLDAVSQRAAQTMNEVAANYADNAAAGVLELRRLAAVLRGQVQGFGRVEGDNAAGFGGAG